MSTSNVGSKALHDGSCHRRIGLLGCWGAFRVLCIMGNSLLTNLWRNDREISEGQVDLPDLNGRRQPAPFQLNSISVSVESLLLQGKCHRRYGGVEIPNKQNWT